MATEKITKKAYFETLKEIVAASDHAERDALIEFIDTSIAQLDSKAAKAKERAAAKKIAGDDLRERIADVLTSEPKSLDDIVAELDEDGLTRAKVTARMSQLVELGRAVKEMGKNAEGKKTTFYKIAE